MSTEIPILYNTLRSEFQLAMANADSGEYIPKPKGLDLLGKARRQFIDDSRLKNQSARKEIENKALGLSNEYGITRIEALDITTRAFMIRRSLKQEGVLFGGKCYNFIIDRNSSNVVLSKDEEGKIISATGNVYRALLTLADGSPPKFVELNETESEFEALKFRPNAMRVDFVLTEEGPMVIEINSQWVDAIGALSGFLSVYDNKSKSRKVINTFSRAFPVNSRLAIIDLAQTSGSRSSGATEELTTLANKVVGEGRIVRSEVIDPTKTRLEYLEQFDAFYINCDPKYFKFTPPDWIHVILRKIKQFGFMFPAWRPSLDKKTTLLELQEVDSVTPSRKLKDSQEIQGDYVLKGDGFSLNSVAVSTDSDFPKFVKYAQKQPDTYIVQPLLNSRRINAWVYNSSSDKIRRLENAFSKLNVWYLNDKVVGMLMTIDETPLISDKGYNAPPIIK